MSPLHQINKECLKVLHAADPFSVSQDAVLAHVKIATELEQSEADILAALSSLNKHGHVDYETGPLGTRWKITESGSRLLAEALK